MQGCSFGPGGHTVSLPHTHAHTFHMQAHTPTPTSPLQPMERALGPCFSSLMETLILAIWKRVSRTDSPGIPWLAQPDVERSRKGDRKKEQTEKGDGRES